MTNRPAPPPPLDHPEQDADYLRVINLRMIHVGVEIVDDIAEPDTRQNTPLKERADIYERATRAVRRGILMAEHLAQAPAHPIAQARIRIQRDVEDAITRHTRDPAIAETFRLELIERLEDPEFDTDLLTRTPADIALDLRRDLGVDPLPGLPRHRRRTPADIAALRATAYRRTTAQPAEHPAAHPALHSAAQPTPAPLAPIDPRRTPLRPTPS